MTASKGASSNLGGRKKSDEQAQNGSNNQRNIKNNASFLYSMGGFNGERS